MSSRNSALCGFLDGACHFCLCSVTVVFSPLATLSVTIWQRDATCLHVPRKLYIMKGHEKNNGWVCWSKHYQTENKIEERVFVLLQSPRKEITPSFMDWIHVFCFFFNTLFPRFVRMHFSPPNLGSIKPKPHGLTLMSLHKFPERTWLLYIHVLICIDHIWLCLGV